MKEAADHIRKQIAAGQNIESIVADLKKAGYTPAQVDAAFKAMVGSPGQDAAAPASDETEPTDPTDRSSHFVLNKLDATQTFILTGLVLILVAVIIVMTMFWQGAGPLMRILFVAGPMALLYVISGMTGAKKELNDIHEGTLLTASFIVPFAVGLTLHQLKIVPEVNALLVGISALAGYLVFAVLEFITLRRSVAPITLLMLYIFIGAFLMNAHVATSVLTIILLVVSLLVGGIGLGLLSRQMANGRVYTAVGVVGMYGFMIWWLTALAVAPDFIAWIIAVVSLAVISLGVGMMNAKLRDGDGYTSVGIFVAAIATPIALLMSLNKQYVMPMDVNALIIALFGPIYLGLSMFVHRISERFADQPTIMQTKRFFEEVAPLLLLVPFTLIGFDKIGYEILALALSFGYIYLSIVVPLRVLLPAGTIGLVVGILIIAAKFFSSTVGLPLVVLLAGFAMIGLSFFVREMIRLRQAHEIKPWYGVGEDLSVPKKAKAHQNFSLLRIVLALILILLLFPIGAWIFFMLLGGLFRF